MLRILIRCCFPPLLISFHQRDFTIFEAAPQESRGIPAKKPQPDYFLWTKPDKSTKTTVQPILLLLANWSSRSLSICKYLPFVKTQFNSPALPSEHFAWGSSMRPDFQTIIHTSSARQVWWWRSCGKSLSTNKYLVLTIYCHILICGWKYLWMGYFVISLQNICK